VIAINRRFWNLKTNGDMINREETMQIIRERYKSAVKLCKNEITLYG
jgi:hypothetical protein